ncbi:MAG: hypothetical protein E6674_10955, partial [Cutibacterium avidum]|nr:hypothetical protein [Cutibacterium avidum]MDU8016639.1 hypothetical protein [Cutibacterium avidum]
DNTPRIIHETGAASHAGPDDRDPSLRGHQQGNGRDFTEKYVGEHGHMARRELFPIMDGPSFLSYHAG